MLDAGICNYVVISYGHSGLSGNGMRQLLMNAGGAEAAFGLFGAIGGYALAATRGMHDFKTGPETWKHIAVDQRKWANLNPRAVMYKQTLGYDEYDRSSWVVEPFRRADCCLVNDGGRAIVVTSVERARNLRHRPAVIMGMGLHNPSYEVAQARTLAGPTGAKIAGEAAFQMAGIGLEEISACEIYDCFTYTVEITLQDYGFFRPGEGEDWFTGGTIGPGGRMPVNTSGGQLSEAYYMGFTPLSEGAMQLMGRCGERQLGQNTGTKEPEIILCSDNGGILQSHSCILLGRGY